MKRIIIGTRNRKGTHKSAIAILLAASCIGITLSGCATDKNDASKPPVVEKISESDMQAHESAKEENEISESTDAAPSANEPGAANESGEAGTQPDSTDTQNAESGTQTLYEQFLQNGISATVRSDYVENDYSEPILEKGNSYTLTKLGERVSKYFLNPEYTTKTSYDYTQYAYVACPDSADADAKNLLIKFVGLNIYSQDDDSYAVFILTEENGQLYITDEYQCWARSDATAYANGTLSDFGSAGAGDHFFGLSAILSNGKRQSIYAEEDLYGWWASCINDSIYSEIFGANTEPSGLVATIYTIGDARYYQYDISSCTEEEKEACETYINRCRDEQAINWVTDDEIQTAIKNQCAALGIDYAVTQQKEEAVWNTL